MRDGVISSLSLTLYRPSSLSVQQRILFVTPALDHHNHARMRARQVLGMTRQVQELGHSYSTQFQSTKSRVYKRMALVS